MGIPKTLEVTGYESPEAVWCWRGEDLCGRCATEELVERQRLTWQQIHPELRVPDTFGATCVRCS